MAAVTVRIAETNNGASHVDLTYDDTTLVCATLAWTNPEGHWRFTAARISGGQTVTRTLNPGDSGSVAMAATWTYARLRSQAANWNLMDSWTRA